MYLGLIQELVDALNKQAEEWNDGVPEDSIVVQIERADEDDLVEIYNYWICETFQGKLVEVDRSDDAHYEFDIMEATVNGVTVRYPIPRSRNMGDEEIWEIEGWDKNTQLIKVINDKVKRDLATN